MKVGTGEAQVWPDQFKTGNYRSFHSYPGNSQRLLEVFPPNESESPGSGTLHHYPQRHRCRRPGRFLNKAACFVICPSAPDHVSAWMTSADVWGGLQEPCRRGRTLELHSGPMDSEVPPLIRPSTKIAYQCDTSLWHILEDLVPELLDRWSWDGDLINNSQTWGVCVFYCSDLFGYKCDNTVIHTAIMIMIAHVYTS